MNLHRYMAVFSCKAVCVIEETGSAEPGMLLHQRWLGILPDDEDERKQLNWEFVHWRGSVFADVLRRREIIAGPGGLG